MIFISNVLTIDGNALGIKDDAFKSLLYRADESVVRNFILSLLNEKDRKKFLSEGIEKIESRPNDIPIRKMGERHDAIDILFQINEAIRFNVEANTRYTSGIVKRNGCFAMKIYVNAMESGNVFSDKHVVIQINLNIGMPSDKRICHRYTLKDEDSKEYIQNFVIYEYNLDKLKKCWYDRNKINDMSLKRENDELISRYASLIALVLDMDELRELSKSNLISEENLKIIKYIEGRMKEMNSKQSVFGWFTPEQEEEMLRNSMIEEAKDEGERIGLSKGERIGRERQKKDSELKLVKKMLLDGLDPSFIKKYVKMSLTEINKIKTTII